MHRPVKRRKILCIDDTPDVRLLVRRLLAPEFDILEAEDGLQGIELAATGLSLVFVDLHMPGLTGYEVATRIKSLLPDVPVIALTADVTPHVRERVLASGCDGYISKPIDPDRFPEQVQAYLAGERELLEDDSYRQAYQQTLVVRLEEKVRELTQALHRNEELNRQNVQLLGKAQRRAQLLEAGARVSRRITSIFDLDALLDVTVGAICDEFGFGGVGVYLLEDEWAVLRSWWGQVTSPDAELQRLEVDGSSSVSRAIQQREPVILPGTTGDAGGSKVVLPLSVGDEVIGALVVRCARMVTFGEDDSAALQILADQLAVAVSNARLLDDLEQAHQELVRSKTYEAIANATGEAIHWVGNKAAPVPGSVARIVEDVVRFLTMANALVAMAPEDIRAHRFAQPLARAAEEIDGRGVHLDQVLAELESFSTKHLLRVLSAESIFEDLDIIEGSAQSILNIKEDLIGPARQPKPERIDLARMLKHTIASMGIPSEVAHTLFADDLPLVEADPTQLERVFINLIKNAMEAMQDVEGKRLLVWARPVDEGSQVVIDVIDNGVGIPPDQIDKIWMAFYTTKGDQGGTGLGVPACVQIVGQLGGKITVESEAGMGTTFSVYLPMSDVCEEEDVERS